jgi:hypothetical protein
MITEHWKCSLTQYGIQGWQYKEIYYLGFVELRMKQQFVKFRIVLLPFSEI